MAEPRSGRAKVLVFRLFAEFAVIVLGVLVALGVDSLATERESALRELELLESLAADLRVSIGELQRDQDFTRGREATLDWLLRYPTERGALVPEDSLPSITRAANWTDAYYPTLRTYETMIATGTFDLISDNEIRLALADVKSVSEVYLDYRNQATQQWNDSYSLIWLEKTGVHPLPGGGNGPDPVPGVVSAGTLTAAMRDDFFRAVLDRRRIFLFYVRDNGNNLVAAMNHALNLIEEELTRRSSP